MSRAPMIPDIQSTVSPVQPPPTIPQRPAIFNVPRNCAQILEFSPQSKTPESQTMLALLSHKPGDNAVALVGMGGAGKTTIVKAIGRHPKIWDAFQGGIWFIELGHDVTLQSFLDRLKELVQDALPDYLEKFVTLAASENTHTRMMNELLDHLEHKRFLLIFDDVWYIVSSVDRLVNIVCRSVQGMSNGSLKVLASTRDWRVGCKPMHSRSIDVNPVASNVQTAYQILFHHAGLEIQSLNSLPYEERKAFDEIVKTCAGLPLALSLSGSSICQMDAPLATVEGHAQRGSFARFWERLEGSIEEFENSEIVGEKGLFASIQLSLQIMEGKWKAKNITIKSMFRSLSILMKQSMLPVRALEKMWGLDSRYVEEGVLIMSRYNVVSTVTDHGNRITGLRMHDLIQDVSVKLAEKAGGVRVWHDRLIFGYIFSGQVDESDEVDERCHGWWKLEKEDEYMRENLVRHLLGAGRGGEALRLLTDFRWIEYVNRDKKRVAFQKIISEMELLNKYVKKLADVEMGNVLSRDIDVIVRTMELCMVPYCVKNRGECVFQLQGRLASLGSESDVVKRLLWSVERYASRPWVRGRRGMLTSAKRRLKRILPVHDGVYYMEKGIDSDEVVVWGCGGAQVMNKRDGSKVFDLDKSEMDVRDVCVDKEKEKIYLCGSSGKVITWGKKEQLCTFRFSGLEEYEFICCARLLYNGKVIVGGSSRGQLVLMDVSTGETIKTFEANASKKVEILGIGNVGDAMVSLCDERIRVWDTGVFEYKWERYVDDKVYCAIMSGNEQMIAAGGLNRSIYLWDAGEGKDICGPLSERSRAVLSLAFSKDDKLLYSGSGSEIIVWDVSNTDDGVALLHKFVHNTMDWVLSLIPSADESELFALGRKGILVWDIETKFEQIEEADDEGTMFFDDVKWFGISADGKTIVTWKKETSLIEVRNVRDVPIRIDNVIAQHKFKTNVYCSALAVSNDQRLVAFSLDRKSDKRYSTVRVLDIENGAMLHTFTNFNEWAKKLYETLDSDSFSSLVTGISFCPNGIITAHAIADIRGEQFTKTLSWDLSTGEPTPHKMSLPSTTSNSTPQLVCFKDHPDLLYSPAVHMRQGADSSIVATLEYESEHIHYIPTTSRLWLSRQLGGLDYVQLITEETECPCSQQPPLPVIPEEPALEHASAGTVIEDSIQPVYDVFISHAGPHKRLAKKIRQAMLALGLHVFVDDDSMKPDDRTSHQKMNEAIQTARAGLFILSRQFGERPWTVLELDGFLARRRVNEARGLRGPVLLPCFFSIEWEDARKGTMTGHFMETLGSEEGQKVSSSLREIAVYTGVRRDQADSTDELVELLANTMTASLRETYGN